MICAECIKCENLHSLQAEDIPNRSSSPFEAYNIGLRSPILCVYDKYISLPADQYPKLVHMLVDHALTGCCTTWLFRDGSINMCTDLVWYWLLLPNKQSEQTTVTL